MIVVSQKAAKTFGAFDAAEGTSYLVTRDEDLIAIPVWSKNSAERKTLGEGGFNAAECRDFGRARDV